MAKGPGKPGPDANEGVCDMTYYYGLNKGDNEYQAASSTASTTSKDIEIVVNNTNVTDRQSLKVALENLMNFILRQNYPL
jgi:NACalpha-BTF3-like transcription factor